MSTGSAKKTLTTAKGQESLLSFENPRRPTKECLAGRELRAASTKWFQQRLRSALRNGQKKVPPQQTDGRVKISTHERWRIGERVGLKGGGGKRMLFQSKKTGIIFLEILSVLVFSKPTRILN